MRNKIILTILFLCNCAANAQYTPLSSQYIFNNVAVNPACVGTTNVFTASVSHRTQWVGFSGNPVTSTVCLGGPLTNVKMAAGLMYYRDAIGIAQENSLYAQYAYRFRIKKGMLALGMGVGISSVKSNWSSIETTIPNDPRFTTGTITKFYLPDASMGVYYEDQRFFAGLSAPFFLTHTLQSDGNHIKTVNDFEKYNVCLLAGVNYSLSKNTRIRPSFLAKRGPGNTYQADFSLACIMKERFYAGVTWRMNDAIVIPLQARLNDQWVLGYSYDFSTSGLSGYHNGSHEVVVKYYFSYYVNVVNPRFF